MALIRSLYHSTNVARIIIRDDNPGINYNGSWATSSFANEGIHSSPLNTTWHEIYAGYSGSFSIQFTGTYESHPIRLTPCFTCYLFFFLIFYWKCFFRTRRHVVILRLSFVDNNPSTTYLANSSLANSPNAPYIYTSGLMLF